MAFCFSIIINVFKHLNQFSIVSQWVGMSDSCDTKGFSDSNDRSDISDSSDISSYSNDSSESSDNSASSDSSDVSNISHITISHRSESSTVI